MAQQFFDLVHTEQIFAEEDDIRFHHAHDAAMRANGFGINVAPGFQNVSAVQADGLVNLPVNMKYVLIAGFFVQRVDILRYDADGSRVLPLQFGDGQVSGIGLGFGDFGFEVVVKIVNQCRIAFKSFYGSNVLNAVVIPQAAGAAKGRKSGLGGDSGSG